nr:hypothetical protein GCM10020185_80840 [Pseudomonas brassicacearum subsp. brassicacearum]
MDERQATIKNKIHAVVTSSESDEITYRSEWLGYLPFPVFFIGLNTRAKAFSSDFPFDWSLEDLVSLERTGFLETLEAYENPEDSF